MLYWRNWEKKNEKKYWIQNKNHNITYVQKSRKQLSSHIYIAYLHIMPIFIYILPIFIYVLPIFLCILEKITKNTCAKITPKKRAPTMLFGYQYTADLHIHSIATWWGIKTALGGPFFGMIFAHVFLVTFSRLLSSSFFLMSLPQNHGFFAPRFFRDFEEDSSRKTKKIIVSKK